MFVYLDDILIASKSISEHMEHVQKVLQQLKEAGLRLKPGKCTFATTEIQYLGHTLTPMGVKPNDSKIIAVKDFPKPLLQLPNRGEVVRHQIETDSHVR